MLSIQGSNSLTNALGASVGAMGSKGAGGARPIAQSSQPVAPKMTTRTALADLAALHCVQSSPSPFLNTTPGSVSCPDRDRIASAYGAPSREHAQPILYKNLQPLIPKWTGEESGRVWGTKVDYLDETQRAQYKVNIQNGLICDTQGKPFDTRYATLAYRGRYGNEVLPGRAIFVMDSKGEIFICNRWTQGKFHHSSFLSGAPVAAAGDIDGGVVKVISRASGHYEPTPDQLSQFAERLRSQGVRTAFKIDEKLY